MRRGILSGAAILLVWGVLSSTSAPAQELNGATILRAVAGLNHTQPPSDVIVRGQAGLDTALGYAPPDPMSPLPLYSTRPENGGLFTFGQFVLYRQSIPLEDQIIAVRGFQDFDGSASGVVGAFVGPRTPALDTGMVDGPRSWQPGFRVGLGWRFRDGSTVELSWMHLTKTLYSAVATLVPPGGPRLGNASDTFLFSGVSNFPADFAGPANDIDQGNPGATFGIWNAADLMTIDFVQRNEFVDITYRHSVYETEDHRFYGMIGPSFAWFWERFKWRTADFDNTGVAIPADTAIYSNTVSNRMYGVKVGCGHERYLGHGFAVSLDIYGGAYLDVVKKRVKFERGDRNAGPERKRSRTDFTVAGMLQGNVNLHWYPIEGVQMRLGYDVMTFFNTIASPRPVDFDYSAVNPRFEHVFRILDGLQLGVGLVF